MYKVISIIWFFFFAELRNLTLETCYLLEILKPMENDAGIVNDIFLSKKAEVY
jgi:hypothetical protein